MTLSKKLMPQKAVSKKSESRKQYQERVQKVLSEMEERKRLYQEESKKLAQEESKKLRAMKDLHVISRVSWMLVIFPLIDPWRPILPIEVDQLLEFVQKTKLDSIWSVCVLNPNVKYVVGLYSIEVISHDHKKFYTFLVKTNCSFNDKLKYLSENKDFIQFVLDVSSFHNIDETVWD